MKSKKGQTLGISIITSLIILLIGLVVINLLTPEIDRFRTNMNCSDAGNISDGNKLTCLAGDIVVIYWILIIFSVIVGGITGGIVSSKSARLIQ